MKILQKCPLGNRNYFSSGLFFSSPLGFLPLLCPATSFVLQTNNRLIILKCHSILELSISNTSSDHPGPPALLTRAFETLPLGLHHFCNLHFHWSLYKSSHPAQPTGLSVHQTCLAFLLSLQLFPPFHPISTSGKFIVLQTPGSQDCFLHEVFSCRPLTGLLL